MFEDLHISKSDYILPRNGSPKFVMAVLHTTISSHSFADYKFFHKAEVLGNKNWSFKVDIRWEDHIDLSYIVTVKSTVEISQNFVAFSECMNFNKKKKCSHVRVSENQKRICMTYVPHKFSVCKQITYLCTLFK